MMKIFSELIRLAALFMVISFITTNVQNLLSSVSSVQYISFDIDSNLSECIEKEIFAYVHLLRFNGRYNPAALVKHLPNRFNCIESIEVEPLPYNTARLKIRAHEPLALVNNKILTQSGKLSWANLYDSMVSASLVSISLPQEIAISASLPSFLSMASDCS